MLTILTATIAISQHIRRIFKKISLILLVNWLGSDTGASNYDSYYKCSPDQGPYKRSLDPEPKLVVDEIGPGGSGGGTGTGGRTLADQYHIRIRQFAYHWYPMLASLTSYYGVTVTESDLEQQSWNYGGTVACPQAEFRNFTALAMYKFDLKSNGRY